ncbi:MAG: translation initiation factor eIF-2B [Candidatus Pacearchaeota archaeon]|nr:translation initiation factor eIF-2B [Candidatus Pacearchaeota archaeon]
MDKFNKICQEIRALKIQGAENVAKAAARALLVRHDKEAVKKLISLRPTEPCLRNTIKFVLSHDNIQEGVVKALEHFNCAEKKIAEIGSRLIKNNSTIFTHCHSNTVMNVLLKAKKKGKKFRVIATETRPLYQGRITASQLAKAKIPITLIVDSAARVALKEADMMFIGCDAITTTKIYNKIGSEMFAIIAKQLDIPVYVATNSWKFDVESIYGTEEKIEERSEKEIWSNAPKGVKILNPAFEKINPDLVTGIISELGIFMKKSFIEAIKDNYPFIF